MSTYVVAKHHNKLAGYIKMHTNNGDKLVYFEAMGHIFGIQIIADLDEETKEKLRINLIKGNTSTESTAAMLYYYCRAKMLADKSNECRVMMTSGMDKNKVWYMQASMLDNMQMKLVKLKKQTDGYFECTSIIKVSCTDEFRFSWCTFDEKMVEKRKVTDKREIQRFKRP